MENLIRRLYEVGAVDRRGKFILSGGSKSDVYFDIKLAQGYPDIRKLIVDAFLEIMDNRTTCVAAIGYGGTPPSSIVADRRGLNLTLVRDTVKPYGTRKLIEGYVPVKGDKVTIIDDVTTTGQTLRTIATVIGNDAEVLEGLVVVKRGEIKTDFPVKWLLTDEQILNHAMS